MVLQACRLACWSSTQLTLTFSFSQNNTKPAEHQSHLLAQLRENFELSDEETQILMRGRNAVTRSKNRRNPAAYQDSTAFECLLGYLYISDQERCCELLNWIETIVDEPSWTHIFTILECCRSTKHAWIFLQTTYWRKEESRGILKFIYSSTARSFRAKTKHRIRSIWKYDEKTYGLVSVAGKDESLEFHSQDAVPSIQ